MFKGSRRMFRSSNVNPVDVLNHAVKSVSVLIQDDALRNDTWVRRRDYNCLSLLRSVSFLSTRGATLN